MWVAFIMVCLDASAFSCQVIAKSDTFYSEEACMDETTRVATSMQDKGIYAVPACMAIGTST